MRYEYTLNGSQIVAQTYYLSTANRENFVEQYRIVFIYDENGAPAGMKYRTPSYSANDFDYYFFEKNLQGDIIAIYDEAGTQIGTYTYDAWGNCTAKSNISGYNSILYNNPFRYRGYYYDTETGLYYLQSRYYNPQWGRFLNADSIMSGVNGSLDGFNLFVYCFNNPVNMEDGNGNWPNWIKKAIAVVAIATVVVAATVVTVATCGAGSVAGVAMITTTATLAARATEVAVLQNKKGRLEGKSGSQIAKDTMESIYDNGAKIIGLTPIIKSAGIAGNHAINVAVEKGFGGTQTLRDTLKSTGGKIFAYAMVAIAWTNTINSAFSNDPVSRANERGYILK